MDIRKLKEDNKPKRYKIRNSEAVLLIVSPKPKDLSALRKKCTFKKRGRAGLAEEFNSKRYGEECVDRFVVGWEGILDGDTPAECNRVNKIQCDEDWTEFSECWNEVVLGIEIEDEEESEEEVKNL
jgi:hypothetical protein